MFMKWKSQWSSRFINNCRMNCLRNQAYMKGLGRVPLGVAKWRTHFPVLLLFAGVLLVIFWNSSNYQGCTSSEKCFKSYKSQNKRGGLHQERNQEEKKPIKEKGWGNQVAIRAAVSFNDSVLLIHNPNYTILRSANEKGEWKCLFSETVKTKLLFAEEGFTRCLHPPPLLWASLYGKQVTVEVNGEALPSNAVFGEFFWKKLVYNLVVLPEVEEGGDILLFVKGLTHRKKGSPPNDLRCTFGNRTVTEVVSVCQENVRCRLPPRPTWNTLVGELVSVYTNGMYFPSVARLPPQPPVPVLPEKKKLYHTCACTMVWNVAKLLTEWVVYHSHIGVERFFIYDNNSEDDLPSIVKGLKGYNVSSHFWPWWKTQEAGFSHCSLKAASDCSWVVFIDVDEFIFPQNFLPPPGTIKRPAPFPIQALVDRYNAIDHGRLGQLKISCLNFGPSGLSSLPKSGQMVNYVCRMNAPKRVKALVRIEAIMNTTYCSRVHHFDLRQGFVSARATREDAVIQHYKFQVWEDFKLKFVRRVATFVADWSEEKAMDSIDRTPGLGTQAMEPPDWRYRFCEVNDTELKNYVLKSPLLRHGNKLLWE